MIGTSYDGTLAVGAASTGVAGPRTIVPEAAISDWYNYDNSDGTRINHTAAEMAGYVEGDLVDDKDTVVKVGRPECTPLNDRILSSEKPALADRNSFWDERDYTASAGRITASVFLIAGQNDENVRPRQYAELWRSLRIPPDKRRIWLHQGGHLNGYLVQGGAFVDSLHRWFDHELLGVANSAMTEPRVQIEREPGRWETSTQWPAPGAETVTLRPTASTVAGVGALSTTEGVGSATITDTFTRVVDEWAKEPGVPKNDRLLYATGPLNGAARISGTSQLTVAVTSDKPAARLSAALVDVGSATIRNYSSEKADAIHGTKLLPTKTCYGTQLSYDDSCFPDVAPDEITVDAQVVSRGWADLGNYASLYQTRALRPDRSYTTTFTLSATDHVVKAGHRLVLVVGGTDAGAQSYPYPRYPAGQEPHLTFNLAETKVTVPVVDGAALTESGSTTRSFATNGLGTQPLKMVTQHKKRSLEELVEQLRALHQRYYH